MRTHFVHHKAMGVSVGSLYLDSVLLVREMKAFRPDDPWGKYSEDHILLREVYSRLDSTCVLSEIWQSAMSPIRMGMGDSWSNWSSKSLLTLKTYDLIPCQHEKRIRILAWAGHFMQLPACRKESSSSLLSRIWIRVFLFVGIKLISFALSHEAIRDQAQVFPIRCNYWSHWSLVHFPSFSPHIIFLRGRELNAFYSSLFCNQISRT